MNKKLFNTYHHSTKALVTLVLLFTIWTTSSASSQQASNPIDTIQFEALRYESKDLENVLKDLTHRIHQKNGGKDIQFFVNFRSKDFNPEINLTLRKVSLRNLIKIICRQTNLSYSITQSNIYLSKKKPLPQNTYVETRIYPISRATVIKMTGL